MNLLLYISSENHSAIRLRARLSDVSGMNPEIFTDIDMLIARLKKMDTDRTVLVFQAHDLKDLLHLRSVQEMMADVRLILILPDWEKNTLSRAHSLFPRFLTDSESDFSDVSAVLNKIAASFLPDDTSSDDIRWRKG